MAPEVTTTGSCGDPSVSTSRVSPSRWSKPLMLVTVIVHPLAAIADSDGNAEMMVASTSVPELTAVISARAVW